MLQTKPSNKGTSRPSRDVPTSVQQKIDKLHEYYDDASKLNCVESSETGKAYHYCLKLPGYILEDFTCYRTGSHLVITTEKNLNENANKGGKRSYCYPSAYFKIHIPLPEKPISDEFDMRYEDDFLFVDLFKQKK